jgi:hypothetical protein
MHPSEPPKPEDARVLEPDNARVLEPDNARVLEPDNARVLEPDNARVLEPEDELPPNRSVGADPWHALDDFEN